jgi:hypothetical protein
MIDRLKVKQALLIKACAQYKLAIMHRLHECGGLVTSALTAIA